MRLNGLYIVTEQAVAQVNHPLIHQYKDVIHLGSLREDVCYIPLIGRIWEHFSFSHFYKPGLPGGIIPFFWPGPRIKTEIYFKRALHQFKSGNRAAAFLNLGRISHLITDMACPVHAHRNVHETDAFEWHVEGNKNRLLKLPTPWADNIRKPSEAVEAMARFTQAYDSDGTNYWFGRILKKLGIRKSVTAKMAASQATDLIPMASAYTASMLRLFLKEVSLESTSISKAPQDAAQIPSLSH